MASGYFAAVRFPGRNVRVEELHRGLRHIALERLRTCGRKNGSFFPQNRQERRLILSEILLDCG